MIRMALEPEYSEPTPHSGDANVAGVFQPFHTSPQYAAKRLSTTPFCCPTVLASVLYFEPSRRNHGLTLRVPGMPFWWQAAWEWGECVAVEGDCIVWGAGTQAQSFSSHPSQHFAFRGGYGICFSSPAIRCSYGEGFVVLLCHATASYVRMRMRERGGEGEGDGEGEGEGGVRSKNLKGLCNVH